MSEMSRTARRQMRAKIHKMLSKEPGKVDASDYGPEETDMKPGVKTGLRPISRRAFKKGGKVVEMTGKDAVKHAGKKVRKGGDLHGLADVIVNRDVKMANEAREGEKHIGGFKSGGMPKKAFGGGLSGGGNTRSQLGQMGGMGNNAPLSGKDFKRGGKIKKADGGTVDDAQKTAMKIDQVNTKMQGKLSDSAQATKPGYADGGEVPTQLLNFSPAQSRLSRSAGLKRGGAAKPFEGTAKDEREDKAQAKKRGMSMKQWEKSPEDKLHDSGCACEKCGGGRVGRKSGGGNWIAGAIKHPGALHRELGVPEGDKIPAKKLASAEHSENKTLAKRARLDATLKRIGKAGGGSIADMECNKGGRVARKSGGKTDINIIISAGPKGQQQPMPGQMPPPPPGGVPIPVGAGGPPNMGGAPGGAPPPMPGGMPPGMGAGPPPGLGGPPPMPRRSGGRTMHHAGAGSGLGRLEKTAIAKKRD